MKTDLAKIVGELLQKRGETLSLAESCTGGAIADAITNVSGASSYFAAGVVAYNNEVKINFLGVSKASIEQFGAVSESVAQQMADGVRRICKTTYSIAVTGIAGPSGGTKEKPVGTVYIALASPTGTEVKHFSFPEGRQEFKQQVVQAALGWLQQKLS